MNSLNVAQSLPKLSDESLDLLLRNARTANTFSDEPVSDHVLQQIYEAVKYGPMAMNSQPLRILFVTSPAAKERLLPLVSPGNRAKAAAAPVTAILAADADFNEHMPQLFPTFRMPRTRSVA